MRYTLFISDLHLDESHPQTTQYFLQFMEVEAPKADALYILGDFFEMWIGDDNPHPFYQQIKHQLKTLSEKIPVYFMQGNRDFLIGKKFAKETGCILLSEFTVISLYGKSILLLHGDSLCSLDIKHMKFRKLTQNRLLRRLFLLLPLTLRQNIGRKLRTTSRQHHSVDAIFTQVVPSTVNNLFRDHGVHHMVHGHTHRPRVETTLINHQPAERIVLGAWESQGCALKWYTTGKREMIFFKEEIAH